MIAIDTQTWPDDMGFLAERRLVLKAEIDGRKILSVHDDSVGVTDLAAWLGQVLASLGHPVRLIGEVEDIEPAVAAAITGVRAHEPGSADWREMLVLEITDTHAACDDCGSYTHRTLVLKGEISGAIMSWFESGHLPDARIRRQFGADLWTALTQLGHPVTLQHSRYLLPPVAQAA